MKGLQEKRGRMEIEVPFGVGLRLMYCRSRLRVLMCPCSGRRNGMADKRGKEEKRTRCRRWIPLWKK